MSKYKKDEFILIGDIVHQLTHTSNKVLDQIKLEDLNVICRKGNDFIERAHILLLSCLKKKHSEVRYNAFQVCCVLFKEYSHYREIFMNDIGHILELTAETNYDLPLPPPKNIANDLKRLTLQTINDWKETYGNQHKELYLWHYSLKSKTENVCSEHVDEVTRQRIQAEERRMQIVNYERIRLLQSEIDDVKPDIQSAISSLDTCIRMIVPTLEDFFIIDAPTEIAITDTQSPCLSDFHNLSDVVTEDESNLYSGETKSISKNCCIDVDLHSGCGDQVVIQVTKENSAIIESAKDQVVLINNKYLPAVKRWLNVATKASDDEKFVKTIIDLKNELETLLTKYDKLQIKDSGDDTDESDMEEVPAQTNDYSVDDIITASILQSDYSAEYNSSQSLITEKKEKNNYDDKMMKEDIGKVGGSDSNVTNEKLKLIENVASTSKLHFPSCNVKIRQSGSDNASNDMPGTLACCDNSETVKSTMWECRAPLRNGKLCPRRDKVKCPFHGVIVARDKTGKCTNPEDAKREQKLLEEKQLANPDWQDPTLLAEIKHATGIDLKMPERGKRAKRKSENDLTNLNAFKNTPYYRLSKKLFKKRR